MVSPSKKGQSMGIAADGEALASTWVDFAKSAKGLILSTAILALLLLIAQELKGSEHKQMFDDGLMGGNLGRRGGVMLSVTEVGSPAPREDCPVVQLKDEISVLYAYIRKQTQKIEDLKAENLAMSTQLRSRSPASGMLPGQLPANVMFNAASVADESFDGGPSGTEFPGFQFFMGRDFDGEDLLHEAELEDNLPALARKCKQMPECQAFNSQGWLKNGLKPQKQWYRWTQVETKGIFVKQEYVATLQ